MSIRAAIFDFDGIIFDTESSEFLSWCEVYAEHGCELTLDFWADCVGRPWGNFDPYSHLEALSLASVDRERIKASRSARVTELNAGLRPRPGVVGYLEEARRLGFGIGLASSSERWWVHGHLSRHGLLGYFQTTKCAEDTDTHKPDPAPYLAVLDALAVRADEAIAFEDSPNGVTAARAAGILTVAIPNPVTAQLPLGHADHRLAEFADVPFLELLVLLGREPTR